MFSSWIFISKYCSFMFLQLMGNYFSDFLIKLLSLFKMFFFNFITVNLKFIFSFLRVCALYFQIFPWGSSVKFASALMQAQGQPRTVYCRLTSIKGYEWGFTDCHGISVRSCGVALESLSCAIMFRNVFFTAAARVPVSLSPTAFLLRNILSFAFRFSVIFSCFFCNVLEAKRHLARKNSLTPRWTCCRQFPVRFPFPSPVAAGLTLWIDKLKKRLNSATICHLACSSRILRQFVIESEAVKSPQPLSPRAQREASPVSPAWP